MGGPRNLLKKGGGVQSLMIIFPPSERVGELGCNPKMAKDYMFR